MRMLTPEMLQDFGLNKGDSIPLAEHINVYLANQDNAAGWQFISKNFLRPHYPFEFHKFVFNTFFPMHNPDSPPAAWFPSAEDIANANLTHLMKQKGISRFKDFHRFSVEDPSAFWQLMCERLGIQFRKAPSATVQEPLNPEKPEWFPDAEMNIVDSLLNANPKKIAIRYQAENGKMETMTYGELNALSNRVADGLLKLGVVPDTVIAMVLPMHSRSIAAYLGILKIGAIAVTVPESFSAKEIASRFALTRPSIIFTQDIMVRADKQYPLYDKVVAVLEEEKAIVVPFGPSMKTRLRGEDFTWDAFLSPSTEFETVIRNPSDPLHILFSSGTTGEPKMIPWTHVTPIKCGSDAHTHLDFKPEDVCAWPTSLGWMMGPWLLFATLLNQACMALFDGAPTGRPFGNFISTAEVSILGVVPSLVKSWRTSRCMEGCDWSQIRLFASTAESSNADDMLYLMILANYQPVIEYCGGTEIGGGYISSTILEPCIPSAFSTPTLGLDFVILDDRGGLSNNGEVAIIPPSIGLSSTLIGKDHEATYFKDMPVYEGKRLRRHGDHLVRLKNGYYRALGRVDDTMNLGGIKVSSVEIERCLNQLDFIIETAAIGIPPKDGGPTLLVIFACLKETELEKSDMLTVMQNKIKRDLNPLFKIHEVLSVPALPRTASNKIMRRALRTKYFHTGR